MLNRIDSEIGKSKIFFMPQFTVPGAGVASSLISGKIVAEQLVKQFKHKEHEVLFDRLSVEVSQMTTRAYSTSFSLGIYFLNRRLRNAVYSIYGFVRVADEIVDSFAGYEQYLLAKFRRKPSKQSIADILESHPQFVSGRVHPKCFCRV